MNTAINPLVKHLAGDVKKSIILEPALIIRPAYKNVFSVQPYIKLEDRK